MNPSASPKQGGVVPPTKDQCESLNDDNETARSHIVVTLESIEKRNEEQEKVLKKAKTLGMAVGTAITKLPSSGPMRGTASSSALANALIPNNNVDGGTQSQRRGLNKTTRQSKDPAFDEAKQEAGVLCENSYVHPGGGLGAHAECKIVNTMTNKVGANNMRGGTMLLQIDWRSSTFKQGTISGMPCPHCFRMLCHAAKECKMKIYVCDLENQPQAFPDNCEAPGAYSNFCKLIDHQETPGRQNKN